MALRRRPPQVDVWGPVRQGSLQEARGPALLLVLALIVSAGALVIAGQGALVQSQPEFTQLWLLPTDNDDAVVGIRNAEQDPLVVRLVVEAATQILGEWDRIELQSDQTFEQRIDIPAGTSTRDPIVATVYLENTPSEPYRQVRLFLE